MDIVVSASALSVRQRIVVAPPLISVHLHPNEFTNSNNWIGPHFLQLVAILFWQHALKQHYGVGID